MKRFVIATIILFFICIFLIFKINNISNASYIQRGIEFFPESYRGYLYELKKKYPNWNFIALYTSLDWNYVINQENIYGKNLVPKNYNINWKNTSSDAYNVEIDYGFVDSSRRAVEYCMDPRNFLNEERIFQFEELTYDKYTHSLEGIEKILYGTEFYNNKVSYYDSNGNTINMNEKYSDLILKASKISKISPYHLASRIKQEVGPYLSYYSISGTLEGYKGLYNFYNIGATSSAEPLGAIKNGLSFAYDGKGASQDFKNRYWIPWNTKERAIIGGAIFIGSSYINNGQNNIYLQKFDVNDYGDNGFFWHQYMTNILAPYSESKSIYNGYVKMGLLDSSMLFVIPIFNNMPNVMQDNPDIDLNDFIDCNESVFCNALNVNIRTGPSTSYEIITTVSNPDVMTRIRKGIQNGERWDKVILENGMIGYIYQNYVSINEIVSDNIIGVNLPLKLDNNYIIGIPYDKNTVNNIKSNIFSDYEMEIVNNNNEVLSESDRVGTGSKLLIKASGKILKEYDFVLYGDCNGDGKINSLDLFLLQRYILRQSNLDEIYKKSANISKKTNGPSSVDLLLIQKHILKINIISQ